MGDFGGATYFRVIPNPLPISLQDFLDTLEALEIMCATPDEIEAILRVISAVMLFGNVKVKQERNSDQAILTNNTGS